MRTTAGAWTPGQKPERPFCVYNLDGRRQGKVRGGDTELTRYGSSSHSYAPSGGLQGTSTQLGADVNDALEKLAAQKLR
jgi:hypothetical protein